MQQASTNSQDLGKIPKMMANRWCELVYVVELVMHREQHGGGYRESVYYIYNCTIGRNETKQTKHWQFYSI